MNTSIRGGVIQWLIVALLVFSIVVLAIAAYFDNRIIVQHVVEAIPYIIGPMACLKRKKFGYLLSFASGAFWWTAGFLTTFIRNAFEQLRVPALRKFLIGICRCFAASFPWPVLSISPRAKSSPFYLSLKHYFTGCQIFRSSVPNSAVEPIS